MAEFSECRYAAFDLYSEAEKHGFEGEWAIVALASANHEIAAALFELKDFCDWAADKYLNEEVSLDTPPSRERIRR